MQHAASIRGMASHSADGAFHQQILMAVEPLLQMKKRRTRKGTWLVQVQILCSPHSTATPTGVSRIGMNHKFPIHCKISQLADIEGFAFSPGLC